MREAAAEAVVTCTASSPEKAARTGMSRWPWQQLQPGDNTQRRLTAVLLVTTEQQDCQHLYKPPLEEAEVVNSCGGTRGSSLKYRCVYFLSVTPRFFFISFSHLFCRDRLCCRCHNLAGRAKKWHLLGQSHFLFVSFIGQSQNHLPIIKRGSTAALFSCQARQ